MVTVIPMQERFRPSGNTLGSFLDRRLREQQLEESARQFGLSEALTREEIGQRGALASGREAGIAERFSLEQELSREELTQRGELARERETGIAGRFEVTEERAGKEAAARAKDRQEQLKIALVNQGWSIVAADKPLPAGMEDVDISTKAGADKADKNLAAGKTTRITLGGVTFEPPPKKVPKGLTAKEQAQQRVIRGERLSPQEQRLAGVEEPPFGPGDAAALVAISPQTEPPGLLSKITSAARTMPLESLRALILSGGPLTGSLGVGEVRKVLDRAGTFSSTGQQVLRQQRSLDAAVIKANESVGIPAPIQRSVLTAIGPDGLEMLVPVGMRLPPGFTIVEEEVDANRQSALANQAQGQQQGIQRQPQQGQQQAPQVPQGLPPELAARAAQLISQGFTITRNEKGDLIAIPPG